MGLNIAQQLKSDGLTCQLVPESQWYIKAHEFCWKKNCNGKGLHSPLLNLFSHKKKKIKLITKKRIPSVRSWQKIACLRHQLGAAASDS